MAEVNTVDQVIVEKWESGGVTVNTLECGQIYNEVVNGHILQCQGFAHVSLEEIQLATTLAYLLDRAGVTFKRLVTFQIWTPGDGSWLNTGKAGIFLE